MNQGHYANKANEIRRLQDIIGKLTRERDALQQQVYDQEARLQYLEQKSYDEYWEAVEIEHDRAAREGQLKNEK